LPAYQIFYIGQLLLLLPISPVSNPASQGNSLCPLGVTTRVVQHLYICINLDIAYLLQYY